MYISVAQIILPNKPLTNVELNKAAQELKIPNFRGVFLRDTLPMKPRRKECGIFNLDSSSGDGTHWVAWYKNGDVAFYFDSYGIQPPLELTKYVDTPLFYNTLQVQPAGEVFCGHLCLYILKEMSKGKDMQTVLNTLY